MYDWRCRFGVREGSLTMRRITQLASRAAKRTAFAPVVGTVGSWSNPATWGSSLPKAGDTLVISSGQTITIDVARTPRLGSIDVQGALIFTGANDVHLTCASLSIGSQGTLQIGGSIGSPARHTKKAKITLTGKEANRINRFIADVAGKTGVGNGAVNRLFALPSAAAETITITFTSATAFSVVGSVSGALGSGTLGVKFSNKIQFLLTAGTTLWATGSTISIGVIQRAFANSETPRSLQVQPNGKLILMGSLPTSVINQVNDHIATGISVISMAVDAGWSHGDKLVIGGTDYFGIPSGSSEASYVRQSSASQITLTGALQYPKWGKLQYPTDTGMSLTPGTLTNTEGVPQADWDAIPKVLDQRAPVINLTRNIVIEGDNDDDWRLNGFGAHCMFMGLSSTIQIDGVEFRRVGQAGAIGRYPLHWHMVSYNMPDGMTLPSDGTFLGLASGQYVKNCSIHQSSQRAITIHGTHGVTVDNNVCYDIVGHAIFLEDGSEKKNIITNNVIMKVAAPTSVNKLLNHDNGSGIWYSNPDNTLQGNRATECAGSGIWNAWGTRCTGLSWDVAENPNATPVLLHSGNTVHSNGIMGMLTEFAPVDNKGTTIPTSYASAGFELTGQRVWKNKGGGYRNRIQLGNYKNWIQADNEEHDFFGASVQVSSMTQMLLVGESLNNANSLAQSSYRCAMSSYHELLVATNCVAINYPLIPNRNQDTNGYGANNPSEQGGGFLRTGDLYTDAEFSFEGFSGLKYINTHFGYRTLPPQYDGAPLANANSSNKPRNYTFAGAIYDLSNLYKNGTDKTYIYNLPFLTYGAQNLVDEPPSGPNQGAVGKRTTSRYLSVRVFADAGLSQVDTDKFELSVDRYDGSTLVGNWYVGPGSTSWGLNNMRHFAAQVGGRYVVSMGTAIPSRYLKINVGYAYSASDMVTVAVPWSGSVPVARLFASYAYVQPGVREAPINLDYTSNNARMYTNVGVTSADQVHADTTGTLYWQDTVNNLVWFKVKNGLTPTNNTGPRRSYMNLPIWIFS